MYRLIGAALIFLLNTSLHGAEGIAVIATVNKNVVVLGEEIKYKVTIIGAGSMPAPRLPEMDGFTPYFQFRSTKYEFVDGRTVPCTVFEYLLVPQNIGKKIIPAVQIIYRGYFYETRPIPVNVVSSKREKERLLSPRKEERSPPLRRKRGKPGPPVFMSMKVNKEAPYINEQIVLTVSVFNRVSLMNNPIYTPPRATGFWKEDLGDEKKEYTEVKGYTYLVTRMLISLFPTSVGEYNIEPATLELKKDNFSSQDLSRETYLKQLFSDKELQIIKSNPITVKVKPLPEEGKPASFNGAVGDYLLSADLNKSEVMLGEPLILELRVSGEGNLKAIPEIELPLSGDFRKHDTEVSTDVKSRGGVIYGAKTFRTVLIPLKEGWKEIPPIEFSFFNPKKESYQTVYSSGYSINVLAPPTGTGLSPSAGEVKVVSRDIHYIKTKAELRPENQTLLYIAVHFFPVFMFILFSAYRSHREKILRDPALRRRKQAYQNAVKLLKEAKGLMEEPVLEQAHFFSLMQKAFTEYLANKLNLSPSGLTFSQIKEELLRQEISDEVLNQARKIWERIDLARYTSTRVGRKELQDILHSLEGIIIWLEKHLT